MAPTLCSNCPLFGYLPFFLAQAAFCKHHCRGCFASLAGCRRDLRNPQKHADFKRKPAPGFRVNVHRLLEHRFQAFLLQISGVPSRKWRKRMQNTMTTRDQCNHPPKKSTVYPCWCFLLRRDGGTPLPHFVPPPSRKRPIGALAKGLSYLRQPSYASLLGSTVYPKSVLTCKSRAVHEIVNGDINNRDTKTLWGGRGSPVRIVTVVSSTPMLDREERFGFCQLTHAHKTTTY